MKEQGPGSEVWRVRDRMGKKLTVYMIDGTAYGPRLSEIGNWVGKAIYSHRASVNKIMNRPEFDNPGIYCFIIRVIDTKVRI